MQLLTLCLFNCRQHSPTGPPEGERRCCVPSGSLQWDGGGLSQQQRANPLLVRGGEGVRGCLPVSQQYPRPLLKDKGRFHPCEWIERVLLIS